MNRRLFLGQAILASATVGVAAPVPKAKGKVDPGDPWKFPDLKSEGWVERKDGLKVWDVKEGEGDEVKAGARIKVHFTTWLPDGTEVYSSKTGDGPLTSDLKDKLKGWQEGLPGMKPGGIRRLLIPSEMAFGREDAGPVPPDSTLVQIIELIDVMK